MYKAEVVNTYNDNLVENILDNLPDFGDMRIFEFEILDSLWNIISPLLLANLCVHINQGIVENTFFITISRSLYR